MRLILQETRDRFNSLNTKGNLFQYDIKLTNESKIIRSQPYNCPIALRGELQRQITEWERHGIIYKNIIVLVVFLWV